MYYRVIIFDIMLKCQVRLSDIGRHVSVISPRAIWRLDNRFLAEPWFATRVGLANIIVPTVSSSNESTQTWFRALLTDKIAWIRVVDEESDTLLVELHTTLEETGAAVPRCVNEYLVEEKVAVYRPLGDVAADFMVDDDVVDSSEDEEDFVVHVVPGWSVGGFLGGFVVIVVFLRVVLVLCTVRFSSPGTVAHHE